MHFVRSVGDAKGARHGVQVCELLIGHALAAVNLNRASATFCITLGAITLMADMPTSAQNVPRLSRPRSS